MTVSFSVRSRTCCSCALNRPAASFVDCASVCGDDTKVTLDTFCYICYNGNCHREVYFATLLNKGYKKGEIIMSTVIRLSDAQVEKLQSFQQLRMKQLELLAADRTESRAFRSLRNELQDKSLSELLANAIEVAIEALETDIDCLTPLQVPEGEEKPKTRKKASK